MNITKLIEAVLSEQKKHKKKKKRKSIKKGTVMPRGLWGPWGFPGWGSSFDSSGDVGDGGSSSD